MCAAAFVEAGHTSVRVQYDAGTLEVTSENVDRIVSCLKQDIFGLTESEERKLRETITRPEE